MESRELVVALDPGETTGWAVWNGERYKVGQMPVDRVWPWLTFLKDYKLDLVVESFDYRPNQGHAELVSAEVIGVIVEWCRQNNVPLDRKKNFQRADQAKFYFKDHKLKAAGLWKPGVNYTHAMDALRHILYYRKDFLVG